MWLFANAGRCGVKRFFQSSAVGLSLIFISLQVQAIERGPIIANNLLGGAGAGAVAGFAAGMLAYGMDKNYHSEYLVNGAVYGFLGGAVLGGGVAAYEISMNKPASGLTMPGYVAGGTGIGALLGVVAAVIPYNRDKTPEDFTIGLGLGGVVGAALGMTVGVIDISSRSDDRALLSGKVGLLEVSSILPSMVPGLPSEPILNARLVELTF
jgi:hypothetical protein